ncbi:uncharacterized protein LOC62_01G001698 [Vanrija pseudolonga]|uniref:ADP-ribosylglycohydrolase family protein n=1 Tax=Vanrija pseudolonga TaxID=143232 RepID=A0AAF1BNI5_9TREE|nr:hypothetical protein LOC62_01G001698 [Vanrija pseudolonga]
MVTPINAPALPADYLERVYAGVLGKLIGVYLGRPFENWTHQRILAELGHIKYYVNDKLNLPIVVPDDDVAGTFAFVRALEEHGVSPDLSSEAIGKTWLNQVVEGKSIFWWGGRGISTEHTAYLNLKDGIAGPHSGSIATNGTTVAEQIGAQIFIDAWALVAPGKPALAAQLADAAGKVSHDGESVYAAKLWAAMEAEAFVSNDIDHLLDTGLSFIPSDSTIARVIAQVRAWVKEDGDDGWLVTRQRIEDTFGYDKFGGMCHVVPNHAIMVLSILTAKNDFSRSMEIINTCGWDTDCNAGNVACLMAIVVGLEGLEKDADWRGPIADRALISIADNGYAVNNAARITLDIANLGRQLAGKARLPVPKNGAQYHFSLPGSVQGFRLHGQDQAGKIYQGQSEFGPALAIQADGRTELTTTTAMPKEITTFRSGYQFTNSPLVYTGQTLRATLRADSTLAQPAEVKFRIYAYNDDDEIYPIDSDASVTLTPGAGEQVLEWKVPAIEGSQPIVEAGVVVTGTGKVWLDSFGWVGQPDFTLVRPKSKEFPPRAATMWDLAWIASVDVFRGYAGKTVFIAQNHGQGLLSYGTREWTDYRVTVPDLTLKLGSPAGVAVRVQGLRRFYALVLEEAEGKKVASLVKQYDEKRTVLASTPFEWAVDTPYEVVLEAKGSSIKGSIGGVSLSVSDDSFDGGALGFVVTSGAVAAGSVRVQPA